MNDDFARLIRIFHQVNTHLTFLASHSRSTIPTYDLLHKLNSNICKLDLAIFCHLLPKDDVTYQYVDENQVLLSLKEKLKFSWTKGYKQHKNETVDEAYELVATNATNTETSKQLLIFDFKDVKTHGIGATMMFSKRRKIEKEKNDHFFLSSSELSVQNLSSKQILGIIIARDKKFKARLVSYLKEHISDEILSKKECIDAKSKLEYDIAYKKLVEICEPKIPQPVSLIDPMLTIKSQNSNQEKPNIEQMMATLKMKSFYKDQIIHSHLLSESTTAKFKPLTIELHPSLAKALEEYKNISIDSFYSHQSQAIEDLNKGLHVIVSTSTSSGKSLIYQLPILNEILWDGEKKRNNTAFFIFPTKALAQDQKRHLQDLINHISTDRNIIVGTYDGDTPQNERTFLRQNADIIFTNPDTIHASILPNYNKVYDNGWIDFLGNLRYVALDELHIYKGTFGVHVSYILRRLNRMVSYLGGTFPQYISCSATVISPDKHFKILCGLDDNISHIAIDGSPKGNKLFLIWQPPTLMNKTGKSIGETHDTYVPRVSIVHESAKILLQLISNHPSVKVIVFCSIRRICEYLMREVRLLLPEFPQISDGDIMSYRGGYSKSDRRHIEQRMFNGDLKAIIATNALELGIDLSELDVVISCGYPMSKANMHQQFGRAGRSLNSNSLAIYVCGATAIDKHYIEHPEELHGKDYEDLCIEGMVESSHMLLMESHLQCAAFELPIDMLNDMHWFVGKPLENNFIKSCKEKLLLIDGYYRTHPEYLPWPADRVSIRAIEDNNYAVVDITNNKNEVIEEVEESRTSFTLYEGAIFLHQGLPYLVREFNTKDHFAKVERVQVEWLTQQRDFTNIEPIEIEYIKCLQVPNRPPSDIPVFYGKIEITVIVFGYFKVNRRNEILEAVEVDNPPIVTKSKGFWLDIPKRAIQLIKDKSLNAAAGIHGAQHAIINILPLFIAGGATTNPNARFESSIGEAELKTECKAPKKEFAQRQTGRKRPPRLIFHDSKGGPSGTGIAAKTFEYIDQILWTTYQRITECDCEWGCPGCVHATFCKEMSLVISKPAAQIILGSLIGFDNDYLTNMVKDGPEENLPNIDIETIEESPQFVKMAPDVQILEETRVVDDYEENKFENELIEVKSESISNELTTVKDEDQQEEKEVKEIKVKIE